jgi:hypothetical protein
LRPADRRAEHALDHVVRAIDSAGLTVQQ